tara:strand:+ start:1721 stop:2185 length:465 start_codon:yes stop_codon:yes gene_type:complete
MKDKAEVKLNPLMIFVISLTLCFFIGELISKEIYMPLLINLFGVFTLFMFIFIFIISIRMFFIHKEKLPPSTPTIKIIKTGIYSYSRNPIYVSFIGFQISMFLIFENVLYLVSSIMLFFWIHYFVIIPEEKYLEKKFGEEYKRYKINVSRWLFF